LVGILLLCGAMAAPATATPKLTKAMIGPEVGVKEVAKPVAVSASSMETSFDKTSVIPPGATTKLAVKTTPVEKETEVKIAVPPSRPAAEILIAVVTAPSHFKVRNAIRETYMIDAAQSGRCDVKFFIGQLAPTVENREETEAKINAETDMVRLYDFTESYHNLSSKALDIFAYAGERGYKAILKVDDDTFVRVPKLLEFWDNEAHDPNIYAGTFVNGENAMIPDPTSKWYMQDQYPYPLEDYANGPGILLGSTSLEFFKTHFNFLPRYRVDDAAVAIWLKDLPINKKRMHVDNYSYWLRDDTVWQNPINADEMLQLYRGVPFTPQICIDTCLCDGDPEPERPGCVTWESFSTAGYQDLVPRLIQVTSEKH